MFLVLFAMVFGTMLVYTVRCLALVKRVYKEFPELAASVPQPTLMPHRQELAIRLLVQPKRTRDARYREIREELVVLRVLLAAGLFGFAVTLAVVLSSAGTR